MSGARLRFTVPGPPVPKARARVVTSKRTGKTRGITPARTVNYEAHVRICGLAARQEYDNEAFKRWSRLGKGVDGPPPRWDTAEHYGISIKVFRAVARGDWDNYAKIGGDALNGILWADDRQIKIGTVELHDCEKGKERVEVEIWVL